jgi:hypothetical protein
MRYYRLLDWGILVKSVAYTKHYQKHAEKLS